MPACWRPGCARRRGNAGLRGGCPRRAAGNGRSGEAPAARRPTTAAARLAASAPGSTRSAYDAALVTPRSLLEAPQVTTYATLLIEQGRAGMARRPRASPSPTGRGRRCGRPWTTSSSGRWCCSRSATCSSRVRPGRARSARPGLRTRSRLLRHAGLCRGPPCAAALQQQGVWSGERHRGRGAAEAECKPASPACTLPGLPRALSFAHQTRSVAHAQCVWS
jgi:hypothetical protein